MTTNKSDHATDGGLHQRAALDGITDPDEGDLLLRITGLVPADEFHPFVVRIARKLKLRGWVKHDVSGALLRAVGEEVLLVQLVRAVLNDAPRSTRIRSLDPEEITAETPPVTDHFAAIAEQTDEWHDPAPAGPATLSHAAA